MKRPVISEGVAAFFAEDAEFGTRYTAVLFRGRVYVAGPRHMDAIKLAFAGMTELQMHRVSNKIADGKEQMLFGTANGDGSDWRHDSEWQDTRLKMYGFD